jgi:hypothetical protein
MRVALPLLAIEAIGATVVEDYDEMAVIDLGPATADALAKATGLGVSPLPDHDKIMLHSFTLAASGGLPAGVTAPAFPPNEPNLYLVVFRSIPKPEWVQGLQRVGAEVVSYMPENAYLVHGRLDALQVLMLKGSPLINVLPFPPAFKILEADRLLGSDGYAKALVQVLDVPNNDAVTAEIKGAALPGTFSQFKLANTICLIGELPNDTVQGLAFQPGVVLIEPAPQLGPSGERDALAIAGQLVSAFENGRTVYKPNCAVEYYTWLSQKGLNAGSDIYLGLLDTGLDLGDTSNVHIDFKNTNSPPGSRVQYQGNPGGNTDGATDCTGHGTLVAAVMAGSGGSSTGTQFSESTSCSGGSFWMGTGVAPAARIAGSKIYDESGNDWALVPNRVGNGLANFAGLGVQLANLSSNDHTVGATGYSSFAQFLDTQVRDASGIGLHIPITITVSASNEGSEAVKDPAPAKNVITVGASEGYNPYLGSTYCTTLSDADNAFDVATFSSSGSTDGRVKPDLVSPGTRTMGAATRDPNYPQRWIETPPPGHWSCWLRGTCDPVYLMTDGSYGVGWYKGTSFAAPGVAGAAGLVGKWYRGTHSGTSPSPAMTKAMLINSALDIQGGLRGSITVGHIPSNYQGWGKVDLTRAFPASSDRFDLDQSYLFTVSGGSSWSRVFTVNNPAQLIHVTLVWADAPANPGSSHPLLNDLDLRVYQIDGLSNCWVAPGNTSISSSSGQSGVWRCDQSYPLDTINNVEQVILAPTLNPYSFIVTVTPRLLSAKAIPWGAGTVNQDFALFVENGR